MKTPHKHAELIKAWADGAQIQYKSQVGNFGWKDDPFPMFDINYEWRIKPEPKPDIVELFYAYTNNGYSTVSPFFAKDRHPNIQLTFDGETGALKAAEVLK